MMNERRSQNFGSESINRTMTFSIAKSSVEKFKWQKIETDAPESVQKISGLKN